MKLIKGSAGRLDSIDIFRAVTMLAMIFVNDLWTLEGTPEWLGHAAAEDDAMGLSDVVFPSFLFIVGLSIPYAISGRKAKGEGWVATLTHIFERTFALLIMGFFIVNYEEIIPEMTHIPAYLWEILMIVGFFLIYNHYPVSKGRRILNYKLQLSGWAILILLAVVYVGGDPDDPTEMETRWWGILGLIGWAYFLCAPLYMFIGDRLKAIAGCWLFFLLFNLFNFSGMPDFLNQIKHYVWIVGGGSMPAFVMAGVLASVIYRIYGQHITAEKFVPILITLAIISVSYGFAAKAFWGISKIRATPAWVGICTGINFILFAFFFWLADVKKYTSWALVLKPAGNYTLTCYLIPYLIYAFNTMTMTGLPVWFRTGTVGLIKSFVFALLVIWSTGKLSERGIRLRI